MKFAFSTTSCPKWDFETIASRAKEYGYDGVEVRGFLNEAILTASNVFLTDPAKLRAMFKYHGVEICCLSSSIEYRGNKRKDRVSADDLTRFIDTAEAVGAPMVKIFDTRVRPGNPFNPFSGESRESAAMALGNWLLPIADYAADKGICIAIENALSFRFAKEMWLILDRLQHPSIVCCWDIFNAALVGEGPAVSIPTLNSRIQYVQCKDAKFGPLGASLCKLGEGDVQIKGMITRLMGIGFDGFVTFEWDKAWLPNIAEPEESLPDAIKKLREWSKPQLEEEEAEKPAQVSA